MFAYICIYCWWHGFAARKRVFRNWPLPQWWLPQGLEFLNFPYWLLQGVLTLRSDLSTGGLCQPKAVLKFCPTIGPYWIAGNFYVQNRTKVIFHQIDKFTSEPILFWQPIHITIGPPFQPRMSNVLPYMDWLIVGWISQMTQNWNPCWYEWGRFSTIKALLVRYLWIQLKYHVFFLLAPTVRGATNYFPNLPPRFGDPTQPNLSFKFFLDNPNLCFC